MNDTELTLVTYGESDLTNLTNFVDSHGLFEEYKAVVPYHVDFHYFLRENPDIVSMTGTKTGLSNSSDTGILKLVISCHKLSLAVISCQKLENVVISCHKLS